VNKNEFQTGANNGADQAAITAEAAVESHLADLHNIRRSRLEILIGEAYDGSALSFAEKVGISKSQVYQFLSTTYNDGKSIGERAARNIEAKAGLQFGWLDQVGCDARVPASLMPRESDAQIGASLAPAKAGTPFAPPKALDSKTHADIIRMVDSLPIERRRPIVPAVEYKFDAGELEPGEIYVGVVKVGSIARHLILLPAEARGVTWQQAKTFAAAVGGELPDIEDYEVLLQNVRDQFPGEDAYWSREWIDRNEAMYLDFGDDPFRDFDSVDSLMRARAVRRVYAGHDEVVVATWHARIKTARESAGMKRNRLAELIGVSPATITQWESGQTHAISGPNLMNVCTVLNIDPGWLLGADDE